jgi:hypothetical protein
VSSLRNWRRTCRLAAPTRSLIPPATRACPPSGRAAVDRHQYETHALSSQGERVHVAHSSTEQLGEAIGYSLEQVASVEQGRRPAKAAFTAAAERVLDAGGVLEALHSRGEWAAFVALTVLQAEYGF